MECGAAHGFAIEQGFVEARGAGPDICGTLKPRHGGHRVLRLERETRGEGLIQLSSVGCGDARQRQEILAEDDPESSQVVVALFFRRGGRTYKALARFGDSIQTPLRFEQDRPGLGQQHRSCVGSSAADVHGHRAGYAEACQGKERAANLVKVGSQVVRWWRWKKTFQHTMRVGQGLHRTRGAAGKLHMVQSWAGG